MNRQECLATIKDTDVFCNNCIYIAGYGGYDDSSCECIHNSCFKWERDSLTGQITRVNEWSGERVSTRQRKNKKFDCSDYKPKPDGIFKKVWRLFK